MKTLALLFLSTGMCLGAETNSFPASSTTWKDQFGSSGRAKDTVLCLMARGFFLAPTTNIQVVTETWLKAHPKAQVVTVSTMGPALEKAPQSKVAFVWIVDGDHSLNIELVRQGCFSPQTQKLAKEQKLDIAQKEYDSFLKRVTEAGKEAKEGKVGIWKDK
jgi:hypothetical protein